MNRKKKINQILKKRQKQATSKLHGSNKPRYISKADRAKMEAEEQAKAAQEQAEGSVEASVESEEAGIETKDTKAAE
ncbi:MULTISPECIES: DUF2986 domain-containing protein [Vibrio]|uniref:DUF2986 domain-containing protein n=1 Tax=Vibrio splendidus TaxID=29497 RepID=A0A1A6LW52_VIBSP|nr:MULTISPECIES: DUF2986 domain-containing protein [Vibrio]MCF7484754.1 DUF2986 domain-containing protein [Vibrio sp. A2-1]NOI89534.1 DUF2986 domain-containing protein [Vibrio splendidus]NOJ09183.1 DUF2986 domain-containing protein [Vibrio splendidus]NOJ12971.1 DUF2986 domain-containing protein [Vibrio splendidus]OBT30952.1 hypothetical protein A9262_10975 [Vibrio splendidus]